MKPYQLLKTVQKVYLFLTFIGLSVALSGWLNHAS